jgi:PAS domain S-box-containing protein
MVNKFITRGPMVIQVTLFSALLFFSAVITFLLAVYGWRNRVIPICKPFTLLMAAATVWAAGEALQTLNIDLTTSTVINVIVYPAVVTVPVAWFMLSLYYAGMERYVTRKTFPLFFVVPLIAVVAVATNPLHYLYYTSVTAEVLNGITFWHYIHGPLFQVLILYSYILSFLAFFLVFSQLFTHSDYYRKQTMILLVASAIPFLFNILYVTQPAGFPEFDITPFSFAIMGILIAIGIIRFRLFSIAPVAHTSLFHGMADAVFVTDQKGTVIDLNPAALRILAISEGEAIGKNFGDLFPEFNRNEENILKTTDNRREIRVSHDPRIQYFDLTDLPIYSHNLEIGHVTMLHDITERRTALNALEAANTKLNLLSDITRHDIMNQLTVLLGYIELSKEKISDPDILSFIGKEEHSALTIKHQIEFTSEYQDIGKQAPKWLNINDSFHVAAMGHNLGIIVLTGNKKNIDIYTDPLFEKVFYNLIDNSLRYGGESLKNIWISSEETGSGLMVIYNDDGAGIPDPDKKKLFTRGFGRTGGMGLFLIREILSITGITIHEDGIPGRGARFEITVPKGAYKYSE